MVIVKGNGTRTVFHFIFSRLQWYQFHTGFFPLNIYTGVKTEEDLSFATSKCHNWLITTPIELKFDTIINIRVHILYEKKGSIKF